MRYVSSATARFLLCESTPRWSTRLRQLFPPAPARLFETPSWEACLAELARHPASFVAWAVEAEARREAPLALQAAVGEFPRARFAVLGERGLEADELLWREAGAIHVVWHAWELEALAGLAEGHLAKHPPAEKPWREEIWDRLPWPECAGDDGAGERGERST